MGHPFPDQLDDTTPRWLPPAIAIVLLCVAIGGAVDLVLDEPDSWLTAHVLVELALMTASLSLATFLWRGWWRTSRSLRAATHELSARDAAHEAERRAWQAGAASALENLSAAIDRQFDAWQLTPAEREVARLLLKGHGHKQVAALTGRSERTVRQHAVSVYQKAGLSGRSELAAYFLEGL